MLLLLFFVLSCPADQRATITFSTGRAGRRLHTHTLSLGGGAFVSANQASRTRDFIPNFLEGSLMELVALGRLVRRA